MRHNLWDRMMYRLLQEKKEKEVKASKSKGSKPDFLDLDKDGDKEEPMSKAAKEAGGKKDTPKAKKGKGKIPPQLRMHIAKKKKNKSKIDEAIEYLEKILIENINEEQADAMLDEYGEEREPDQAEQDLDDDFNFDFDDEDEDLDLEDEEYGDESMESEEMSDMDSDGFEGSEEFMEEGLYSNDYKDDDDDDEGDMPDECPHCGSEEEWDMESGECRKCGYESDYPHKFIDDPFFNDDQDEEDPYEKEEKENPDFFPKKHRLKESQEKKQPRLGKVTRNPAGSKKKFHVYVKCGGRVKKISFGDPGLSIKRDSPARRKNFRARHKCDKPAGKDRCTARYWSCYQWRAGKKVEGEE